MELRVYYESLEQAAFFIKPILLEAAKKNGDSNVEIKLIYKHQQKYQNGKFLFQYAKKISEILIDKNPDIIISLVEDNVEYPVSIIELSTAVFTKDHELQRTDNFNVAYKSKTIYIKISPLAKDSGNHGGDTSYNFVQQYAKFWQKYNMVSFHINWEVDEYDVSKVKKHPNYKSIPNTNANISHLLYLLFNSISTKGITGEWIEYFKLLLKKDENFKLWISLIEEFNNFENIKELNSTRTQWEDKSDILDKTNVFTLKFNRMGHAMDPERGMLNYYYTFYKDSENTFVSKFVFDANSNSFYKDTPQENDIADIISKGINSKEDLLRIFFMGLTLPDYEKAKKIISNTSSESEIVDITEYINSNFLNTNIAFRNIILNSDILYLTDNDNFKLLLTWEKKDIPSFNYVNCPDVSNIYLRKTITEDDVTFITIHNFFKENGMEVLSVSYPGAQSDMPILPEQGLGRGRRQKRIYIDAIAKKDQYLLFQENKGIYSIKKTNDDISKLALFKTNGNYKEAVVVFKKSNRIEAEELILGVGFAQNKNLNITELPHNLKLNDIDYFFIISNDMKKWKVFSSVDGNLFQKLSGDIDLTETFEVKAGNN